MKKSFSTKNMVKSDPFKIFLRFLYIISLSIYVYFLIDGLGYYSTPHVERPHMEEYRNLRPAGPRGHTFGVVGATMMLLMLLYSVRKRTRFFGKFGQLSRWLDIHIYLGIMGPLFIILHTTLRLNGIISVAFWSMIAVASSGILGRYLYLQIPRHSSGEELSLREIEEQNRRFADEMKLQLAGFQVAAVPEELNRPAMIHDASGIIQMTIKDILSPLSKRRLRAHYRNRYKLNGAHLEKAVILVMRKRKQERRLHMLNQVQRFFHYWHVFHKPFAILMFIIMFVHIGVAIWLGYAWVV